MVRWVVTQVSQLDVVAFGLIGDIVNVGQMPVYIKCYFPFVRTK
jgi:hypothetical protein